MTSGKAATASFEEAGRGGGNRPSGELGEWLSTLLWNQGSLMLLALAVLLLADGGQLGGFGGGLAGVCSEDTFTSLFPHDMLAPRGVRCTCDPSAGCDTQLPILPTSVKAAGQYLKGVEKCLNAIV